MRDVLGPGSMLGYCTNVHGGSTLDQTKANLEEHALAVKAQVSPNAPMGIGLWLSASAASELEDSGKGTMPGGSSGSFGQWLAARGLDVFTINGFPYGDFHQEVVKHDVYVPSWEDRERVGYTESLARFLPELSAGHDAWSVSTLPIGWRGRMPDWDRSQAVIEGLLDTVAALKWIEDETGRLVHLDLEPEPGCCLDRSEHVVALFEQLAQAASSNDVRAEDVRRYLRVCHDICHASVMFEDQAEALATYRQAGIAVGKVHISSAVCVAFDEMGSAADRCEALRQLGAFAEDRYLHQTMIRREGELTFHDDLPDALAATDATDPRGQWRVHFHVPIFLDRFGLLETTRDDIGRCLNSIDPDDGVYHFEIETYAWNVLPDELRRATLADGIAQEIQWFKGQFGSASHE